VRWWHGGGNVVAAVNNRVYDNSKIFSFYLGTDTESAILIQAQGASFRGALIRASSPDGAEFTLAPGVNARVASACTDPNVHGVTDTNNDLKTELSATLNIATAGTVTLDVTDVTVIQASNANDGSFYFYTPYALTAEYTLSDVPTVEPVDLPATPTLPYNGTTAKPPSVTPMPISMSKWATTIPF
jgi:hypothetical protein